MLNGIWKVQNAAEKYFYYLQKWFMKHDKDLLLIKK